MPNEKAPLPPGEFRDNLRREMLARRSVVTPDEMARLSQTLTPVLSSLLDTLTAHTVGFCWPWRGEFDVRDALSAWLSQDSSRQAALPVITEVAAPMRFRAWRPGSALMEGRLGIPVPVAGDWLQPDLFLLPVVAVDAAGYRLGYGGGYFDRTLAALNPRPVAVGVGFEWQVVDTIAPQAWDERLDWVVTEAGARRSVNVTA